MAPSYYEINVSRNGIHFFATHQRSITDERTLKRILEVFKEKFPTSEGYQILATAQYAYGKYVFDSKGECTK